MFVNSAVFLKGQVWYWEDPIFGSKKDGKGVNERKESTTRYSRYCIIMQNTNTMNSNNSVLVVPCSSSYKDGDIKIPLSHKSYNNFTYAKVNKLFPVHFNTLHKYICTLSPRLVSQIETEISKLLLSDYNSDIFNITVEEESKELDSEVSCDEVECVKIKRNRKYLDDISLFIENCITENKNSSISVNQLKNAYEQFCNDNNIEKVDKFGKVLLKFKRTFKNCLSSSGRGPYVIYNGVLLKKYTDVVKDSSSDKSKNITSKGKWSEKNKIDFIKFYDSNGAIEASKKYKINKSSVYTYIYRWKKELNVDNDSYENENSQNSFIVIGKDDDINRSIMKLSTMICRYLQNKDLFNTIGYVFIDGRFVNEETFYYKLRLAIYISILDSLNIIKSSEDSNKLIIPDFTKVDSEFRESFIFLDKIYNDRSLSYIDDVELLFEKYHEKYESEGFNNKWISLIGEKVNYVFDNYMS